MEKNVTALRPEEFLQKIDTLPSLPAVIAKIKKALASPDANAKDVEQALKMDPAVAGKILKLANSAYIGLPRSVSSLKNAVVLLGRRRIYSLVVGAAILSLFKRDSYHSFTGKNFWKHSVVVALVAESIAEHMNRHAPIDSGEIFSAGILHDIGKLVLGIFSPEHLAGAYRTAIASQRPFYMHETPEFSHTRIGSMVAEKWNFPLDLVHSILNHHTPERETDFRMSVTIIYVADIMAHVLGINTVPQERIPDLQEDMAGNLGLEPEALRAIAHDALDRQKRMESFIEFFS